MTLPSGLVLPAEPIAELCRRHHVKQLAVFGSQARGDAQPDSDIDFLVEFEEGAPVGLIEYAALMRELSETLGRKVDLVSKRGLKPLIRDLVLREAIAAYAALKQPATSRSTSPVCGRMTSPPTVLCATLSPAT